MLKTYPSFHYQNIIINGHAGVNLFCIYRFQEVSIQIFLEELEDLIFEHFQQILKLQKNTERTSSFTSLSN